MKKLYVFLWSVLFMGSVQGQIIHVPSTQYPTIQSGIDAANPGDTVLVADGVYQEQINFLGKKPLMVTSQFLMDGDTSHIQNTIIDGSQINNGDSCSIVYFISGEDTTSVLYGFTVKNGTKGTKFLSGGDMVYTGAGVYISGSGARIAYNNIQNNTLTISSGVGITVGAGVCNYLGTPPGDSVWVIVEHNTIENNTCSAPLQQADAAGMWLGGNCIIRNNTISGNQLTASNSANAFGAGLSVGNNPSWPYLYTAIVTDNVIKNNKLTTKYFGFGAGVAIQATKVYFAGNLVENNTLISQTGLGTAGGIDINMPKEGMVIKNNIFRGNSNQGSGGAMYVRSSDPTTFLDTALVEGNYFYDNSGSNGGGAQIDYVTRFQNNVFSGNQADAWGGAVSIINAVSGIVNGHMGILVNNSFSGNTAGTAGGAVFSFKGKPIVVNSIFWGNTAPETSGPEIGVSVASDFLAGISGAGDTLEIAFSDITESKLRGPWKNGSGNIDWDPVFMNPEALMPEAWSPCVDAGTEQYQASDGMILLVPGTDILGTARPAGLASDIGAHEQIAGGVGISPISRNGLKIGNYPNPFSRSTTLTWSLSSSGNVTLRIMDLFGRMVYEHTSGFQQTGEHSANWDSGDLPPGTYFIRIESGGKTAVSKVTKL